MHEYYEMFFTYLLKKTKIYTESTNKKIAYFFHAIFIKIKGSKNNILAFLFSFFYLNVYVCEKNQ
jgi:hypothetical protein